MLAGSCAERTFDQLAHFARRRPVLFLDPARAADGADLVAEALAFAKHELAGGPAAIATSARVTSVPIDASAALREADGMAALLRY